jgi:hypothetical protein
MTTIVSVILVTVDQCETSVSRLVPLRNLSGYIYCTGRQKGVIRQCPLDTVPSLEVGGCINRSSKYICEY